MIDPLVEDLAREEAWFAGVTRRRIDEAEIVERLVLAMVNEAAAILSEGIAARASDIDLVYLTGYGFPIWRGGPMHYAESRSLYEVARRMREFATLPSADEAFWQPADLLQQCIAAGHGFDGGAA